MKYILFAAVIVSSCKKNTINPGYVSQATYTMTVTINWTSPQFTVPAGAHVTKLVGMVHSRDTFLWKEFELATPGLEDVAETGNNIKINAEIDGVILKNKALSKFELPAPPITGSVETRLTVNSQATSISFASMIAPSPDWFLGISNADLLVNNKWVDDLVLNVKLYDAGTEDGDVFGYNNPSTIPQQPVRPLTPSGAMVLANGNPSMAPIATVHLKKL